MPRIGEDLQRILDVIQEDTTETTNEIRSLLLRKFSSANLSIAYGIDKDGNILEQDSKDMFYAFITKTSNPSVIIQEEDPTWLSFLEIRDQMVSLLKLIFKYTTEEGGGIISYPMIGGLAWSTNSIFGEYARLNQKETDKVTISIQAYGFESEKPPKDEITIRKETHRLLDNLSNIPVSNLKICPGPKCGKFFVQQTKRERKFCSTKCRNKFNIKDKYIPKKERK